MAVVCVLGPVTLGDAGPALSPRDRKVLQALVARRDQQVSSDTLAEALWGEEPPASSAKVVQGCIGRLRRRLGPDAIVTERNGYRLVLSAEEVDAGRFERLVLRAGELLTLGHADQAVYAVDAALAMWHGSPLPDLEDWEPGRGEATRLDELRLHAQELRLSALLASGRHHEAAAEAALRVREQPLRESRWALLARAHYQGGRQAEALGTLRHARQVLAEELGLDPGRELVELEQAVLQQDPGLTVPEAPLSSAACPWPGLAAYDVDDADAFFGRRAELDECLQRLARNGFLAVVGPSGSGKSSLVRAGLAAHLRAQGRSVAMIVPAPRPVDALAAAVRNRTVAVLVVDQFEELFTTAVAEETRIQFLDMLVEQVGLRPVVVTLRADRLGELTAYPDVARLVEDGLYLLKAMGREGLCAAIEEPARRAGLLPEQGLVDLLVRDVEGAPGSLPMLAHALRETWRRREGITLTVQGYRDSGGIRGAVAQSAEKVYEDASEAQRLVMREMLLRMVRADPGGDPVRTSVPRDALTADTEHEDLLERLVRARLVTTERDRVEIAHEALARAWPRLQSWLADDIEGERIRHHLAATAEAWEVMGRPDSELYRGARLAATREWWDRGAHRLNGVEQDFLDASDVAHRSKLAQVEAESHRQRRVNRRLRVLVLGVAALALVAAGFGAVAGVQWRQSQDARVIATAEASRAVAHELSATAVSEIGRNPALAKALAVVAATSAPSSPQAVGALHRTVSSDQIVSRVSMNHSVNRLTAVLHPDGTRVAMTGENAGIPALALEVHDAHTGALVWEWVRPEEPGYESALAAGAAYSTDGSLLAGGVVWNPEDWLRIGPPLEDAPPPADDLVGIHLWDASTHERVRVLDVGPCGGWPIKASEDKVLVRRLAAPPDAAPEDQERILRDCRWSEGLLDNAVVDVETGEAVSLGLTNWTTAWTFGVAMSGDGAVGAVFDPESAETVLVDVGTGAEIRRIPLSVPHDLDPTGQRVLLTDQSRPTSRWVVASVDDGRTVSAYRGHTALSVYGGFSADGSTALTTAIDNTLVEWSTEDGLVLRRTPAAGDGRPSSALGRWTLVPRTGAYGAVLVDGDARGETWTAPACGPGGFGGFGAADQLRVAGDRVVFGRDCGTAQGQWESVAVGGTDRVVVPQANFYQGLEVSPDGRYVVSHSGEAPPSPAMGAPPTMGALQVRDARTGEVTLTLQGVCPHELLAEGSEGCDSPATIPFPLDAWRILWSPDGRWIVAIDLGEGLAVWDASTGEVVTTLATSGLPETERWGPVFDGTFSPTSDRLVLSTYSGVLVAFDTSTWAPVVEQSLGSQNTSAAGPVGYAEDGTLVVVTPFRDNAAVTAVLLVDPDTLEVRESWPNVTEGSVRSAAISPDGTRLALATSEGTADVWDLASGALLDRADPGVGRIQGVQWLDDRDLVLMGNGGEILTVTTDPERLLSLARQSLTRGLTQTDCTAYGIDPCPDLAELRGDEATVPEELRGTYALSWTAEELTGAFTRHYQDAYRAELDPGAIDEFEPFAADLAGDYRLEIDATSYQITKGEDVWCSGQVTTSEARPDRVLLGADRGSWCLDFHLAELGWEVTGDSLTFPAGEFRGPHGEALLLTTKPLQRVE